MVWLAISVHACLRAPARAWQEQAGLAAAVFGLLPALNAMTTSRHLGHSVSQGDWVMAGFDLAALAIGVVFLGLAWMTRQRRGQTMPAVADTIGQTTRHVDMGSPSALRCSAWRRWRCPSAKLRHAHDGGVGRG